MTPTARSRLGAAGEGHARRYLEARGYRFVAANWRCAAGEVDLVMLDSQADEVVFVEVKTRRGEAMGRADESVTSAKARRVLATATAFLAEHAELQGRVWRVDLVALTLGGGGAVREVAHHINAIGDW